MIGCQTSSPSDYRFKQPEKKRWATRLSYLIAIGALSLVELLMFIVGSACNAEESTFESFEFPDFHDGKIAENRKVSGPISRRVASLPPRLLEEFFSKE